MSLKINYNVSAMIANNSLKLNDVKLTTSLERLSSGYKINSARDDAAGLAISRRMNAQIKGLKAASQDTKDGISVIEIADGALSEVHDILQRMNELAVKSANGTMEDGDREAIQMEIQQLGEEIDRIGQTTEYNSQRLFTGEFDLKGYTDKVEVKVDKYSDANKYGVYGFDIGNFTFTEDDNGEMVLEKYLDDPNNKVEITRPDDKKEEYRISGDMYHLTYKGENGDEFTLDISGYKYEEVIDDAEKKLKDDKSTLDSITPQLSTTASKPGYPQTTTEGNTTKIVDQKQVAVAINGNYRIEVTGTITEIRDENGNVKSRTESADVTTTYTDAAGNKFTVKERIDTVTDQYGNVTTNSGSRKRSLVTPPATTPEDKRINVDLTGYGAMTFQIGSNESQTLDVRFEKLSMESLGFKHQDTDQSSEMCLDLSTEKGALRGIDQIDAAIEQVSHMRSRLGAYQNRLEHTESNLATSEENMTAGYSRIMDTDMAEEMSTYSNLQIVSQAATAILTQANERPSQMLQLLQ